jgi:sugar phosphate isomerase/epimerase
MHLSYAVPRWRPENDPDLRALTAPGTGPLVLSWPQVAALPQDVRKRNVLIDCIDLGEIECGSDSARDALVSQLADRCNTAAALAAPRVSITAGGPTNRNFSDATAVLHALAPIAQRLGLRLCIRNRFDSSVEQLDELHVLFRDAAASDLQLDLDVGAFQRAIVNPCDAVLSFSGRIGQVRLTDLRGRKTVPLGQGDVNVPAVLESLIEERFTGPIVLSIDDAPNARERLAADQQFLADLGVNA